MKTQKRSAGSRSESLQVSAGAARTIVLAVDDWDEYDRLLMPHVVDGFVGPTWFEQPNSAVVELSVQSASPRVL